MAQPRPVKVRLHLTGEDKPRVMALAPGISWAKFADSIDALCPRIIEALDSSDQMVRAMNTEFEPLEEEHEQLAEVLSEDPTAPEAGDGPLETFARLLADAHRTSSERSFQFVEVAFARMVDIVNAQTKRMDSMERTVESIHRVWRGSYEQRLAEGGASADGEDGGASTLLQQMLSQFMAGAAQTKANGAANGVHPKGNP
jgi:hypothetical protein